MKTAIKQRTATETHDIRFVYQSGMLFITFPSGRRLSYVKPKIGENRFGGESVTYEGVGIPTEPNAVGVAFATRQATVAGIGENPSPQRIPAGIATAVPNPAIPSRNPPNPQPINSSRILRSFDTPVSTFLIFSILPVAIHRL